jgi:long-chain acyl-CoA synthetase
MTAVMNSTIAVGAWMMLFPRPPETQALIDTILKYGPDEGVMYCGAEVLFQRLTEHPGIENSGINKKMALCISGAGPLHRPVQEAFEAKTNGRLVEGFGLTETSPVISASPFWGNRVIGSIGLPFPGTDWMIRDASDFKKKKAMVDLDAGEEPTQEKHYGEICVAGPQIMVGYLNQPEETAETILEEGGKRWLLTGDIGYMDTHGRIYIRDRKKQLIKVRGYSVFPKEIEELVGENPAVLEVAAAGLPDKEMGEKIKVWIVLRREAKGTITPEALRAWCKESMTHYKVPGYVEFVDELPKTLVGKVLRRVLQENDPIWKAHYGDKKA